MNFTVNSTFPGGGGGLGYGCVDVVGEGYSPIGTSWFTDGDLSITERVAEFWLPSEVTGRAEVFRLCTMVNYTSQMDEMQLYLDGTYAGTATCVYQNFDHYVVEWDINVSLTNCSLVNVYSTHVYSGTGPYVYWVVGTTGNGGWPGPMYPDYYTHAGGTEIINSIFDGTSVSERTAYTLWVDYDDPTPPYSDCNVTLVNPEGHDSQNRSWVYEGTTAFIRVLTNSTSAYEAALWTNASGSWVLHHDQGWPYDVFGVQSLFGYTGLTDKWYRVRLRTHAGVNLSTNYVTWKVVARDDDPNIWMYSWPNPSDENQAVQVRVVTAQVGNFSLSVFSDATKVLQQEYAWGNFTFEGEGKNLTVYIPIGFLHLVSVFYFQIYKYVNESTGYIPVGSTYLHYVTTEQSGSYIMAAPANPLVNQKTTIWGMNNELMARVRVRCGNEVYRDWVGQGQYILYKTFPTAATRHVVLEVYEAGAWRQLDFVDITVRTNTSDPGTGDDWNGDNLPDAWSSGSIFMGVAFVISLAIGIVTLTFGGGPTGFIGGMFGTMMFFSIPAMPFTAFPVWVMFLAGLFIIAVLWLRR